LVGAEVVVAGVGAVSWESVFGGVLGGVVECRVSGVGGGDDVAVEVLDLEFGGVDATDSVDDGFEPGEPGDVAGPVGGLSGCVCKRL
jgi:hypothetical protein